MEHYGRETPLSLFGLRPAEESEDRSASKRAYIYMFIYIYIVYGRIEALPAGTNLQVVLS